jgi:glucose/arabinose dehydrogenase
MTLTTRTLAAAVLLAAAPPADAQQPAAGAEVNGGITLPAGFRATVFADNLGRLRFLTVAPNGDVYVKTSTGSGILALRDDDKDGRAETKAVIGDSTGTGIEYRDGWLYHSTNSAVLRYRMKPGELVPAGVPETIVSGLVDERQHASKTFAFDDQGRLYVEVGSPSNSYGGPGDRSAGAKGKGEDPTEFFKSRGGFWRFDANKPGQTQADGYHFATGLRHVLPVTWNSVSRKLFVVQHGRDVLNVVDPEHYTVDDNEELPAEEMHVLKEGGGFGWPFTYYDPLKKARMVSPEYGGDNQKRAEAGKYPDPLVAFPAHWAPMQMAFYNGTQFPAKYRGGAFLAFHGSWNRAPKPQKGYNVVYVPFDAKGMPRGTYEVFADGFKGPKEITNPNDATFRPNGVGVHPDGSLIVSDSQKGRVWKISHTGDKK